MNNLFGVLLVILGAIFASGASGQPKIKVAGMRTFAVLPFNYAVEKGYFRREGLDVEVVNVNTGPAAISALMSDSVDIAYSASLPVLFARAERQPVKIFAVFSYETPLPDGPWTWIVASERSGVKSVKDLAGRTVALNAFGGGCELMLREFLAKAGMNWSSVKEIALPFPQMRAALQLGNVDAACIVEPFRTQARVAPAIKAIDVAAGMLADGSPRWALDVVMTREDWGLAHKDELRRFKKALAAALSDFRTKPGLYHDRIVKEFKVSPAAASLMKGDLADSRDLSVRAGDLQPLIDALGRQGLLTLPMKAEDLILPLQ